MKLTVNKFYPIICLLLISSFACKKRVSESSISEGIIEYNIIYSQDRVGNFSSGVLPQKMIVTFKNSHVMNSIEGVLGFFHLVNLTDLDKYTNTTYLKFIDKKYVYKGKRKESPCCFQGMEGMQVTLTDETKTILGFECKKALITFPETLKDSFNVYYTTEIKLKRPNSTSPFKDIPGVLLEFKTMLGKLEMTMIAEEYRPEEIPDKDFLFPSNYREVSKYDMEKIINALLE